MAVAEVGTDAPQNWYMGHIIAPFGVGPITYSTVACIADITVEEGDL